MAKTDKKTLELINEVRRQKTEIAKIERPNWQTNCSFSFSEGRQNDAVNIHVCTELKVLIRIASCLQDQQRGYKEAAELLAVENPPAFMWSGYTVGEWLDDLKLRVAKIQITAKRNKLDALEGKLNAILSPEQKAALELDAIAAELEIQ